VITFLNKDGIYQRPTAENEDRIIGE